MQVLTRIGQIPSQFDHALVQVIVKGAKAMEWIDAYWKKKSEKWSESDLWKNHVKPLYERNIVPLKRTDYLLFGGSLCTAALITKIVKTRGIEFLPLTVGLGALLISGTGVFLRNQIHAHFNDIAWEHLDQIRRIAHDMDDQNQEFAEISQHQASLMEPNKFYHIKKELEGLDEKVENFKKAMSSLSFDDEKKIVKAHIDNLKMIVQGNAGDKALVEALEKQIDKVGGKKQNLKVLEKQKQKLNQLQTAPAILHILELKNQINHLVKISKNPSPEDNKKSFIAYVEGLQVTLVPNKEREDL